MYIITGVSRGLGKGIALALLANGEMVLGIGRSCDIEHANFRFIECDLNDLDKIQSLEVDIPQDKPVTLINNAGIIGDVKRVSDQEIPDLHRVLTVNTVAPIHLTHKVYQQLKDKDLFTLVNISSGAANRAIPSWAAYCASKAALNMMSETFFLEEREKGNKPKVYAVAPGVIDTGMQTQIREAGADNFSSIDNFIALKENEQLYSSEEAADRLIKLLNLPYADEVFFDLRSI